jgi:hypothetical protein
MNTQICIKCKLEKELSEFYYRNDTKTYRKKCKKCHQNKEYQKQYKIDHLEDQKKYHLQYYVKNKDKILHTSKIQYQKNKEYYEEYRKIWYQKNKEKHSNTNKRWYINHKKDINKKQRKKRNFDINYKILVNLRRRLHHAIYSKNINKIYHTIELLGCTIDELKQHLEKQFKEGMSWDNYGKNGWNIDHIIPCAVFDFSDPVEQKQCFHYSNLQPLWWLDNIQKSNKIVR